MTEPKPMDPERLAKLRERESIGLLMAMGDTPDLVAELLAAHDDHEARAAELHDRLRESNKTLDALDRRLVERQRERDEARRFAEEWRGKGWGAPEPERSGHLFPWEVKSGD